MRFVLPRPPSVNSLYRFHCRRGYPQAYIDTKGREWFAECGLLVRAALKRKQPLKEECEVAVDLYHQRPADIDNVLKASLDLLEKAGVLENDRLVTSLVVHKYKVKRKEDERLELEVL